MSNVAKLKEYIGLASATLGILAVVVGAAFWLKDLDARVTKLEKQQPGNLVQSECVALAKRAAQEGYMFNKSTKEAMDALGCQRAVESK